MFLYLIEHKDTKAQSYVLCGQIFESPKSLCSIIIFLPFFLYTLKYATKIQRKKHNDSLLRQKNKEKSLEHLILRKLLLILLAKIHYSRFKQLYCGSP